MGALHNGMMAPLVDGPFEVEIEHPPLHLEDFFHVTRAFDLREQDFPFPAKEELGHDLRVHVLAVTANTTRLRILPLRPLRLAEAQDAVMRLLHEVGALVYGGRFQVMCIDWGQPAQVARVFAPQR